MSYDLSFYTESSKIFSRDTVFQYLSENLCRVNEMGNQWFFENKDTGVYYSFETASHEPEEESPEEEFDGFNSLGLAFNLNFLRPDFFGLEAFGFVERFIEDLDLYIGNPQQGAPEHPYKPEKGELYSQWSATNIKFGRDMLARSPDSKLLYYPADRSNLLWEFNFNKSKMQSELGEYCIVLPSFFVKTNHNGELASMAIWRWCIPCLIPPVDYFILVRRQKRLFKEVDEEVIVSYSSVMNSLGKYFEDYGSKGYKRIDLTRADKAGATFNSLKYDFSLDGFFERVSVDEITNIEA